MADRDDRTRVSTPRVNRLVFLMVGLLVLAVLLYLVRGAVFPFIVGGALAYMLHPLVVSFESIMPWRKRRPDLSRALAILVVYVIVVGMVAGILVVFIPPIFRQSGDLFESLPEFIASARSTIEGWNQEYASMIPEEIRAQIEDGLENAGTILIGAAQNVVLRTASAAAQALTIVIGLAIVPLFLFYVLKDREAVAEGLVSVFPATYHVHVRNIINILNRVLGAYVKAQLILGLVVGIAVALGLSFLGIKFAILLGAVAGLFELVPIIGPWLGAIPGVLVTLATSPEQVVWVALVYLVVQLLENMILVPRIQSLALNVHPILIMVALVVGSEAAGLWGVVLGPPLAAAAKEVFKYFSTVWSQQESLVEVGPPVGEVSQVETDGSDGGARVSSE